MTDPRVMIESILRWEEFLHRGKLSGQKFVHYTSAEVAVSIIEKSSIWMRNAAVMNDFSEIEHGQECFEAGYRTQFGYLFRTALDLAHPGLTSEFESCMADQQHELRTRTYLTCLSEHDLNEDDTGRLSMWRAYGGSSGVALVVNTSPFMA